MTEWKPYPQNKPEQSGIYYVTVDTGDGSEVVLTDWHSEWGGRFPAYEGAEVLAWMPEPEPYTPPALGGLGSEQVEP